MAAMRNGSIASDVCQFGEHGECRSCKSFVRRRGLHIHVYRRNPPRSETICEDCWVISCLAAIPVLEALKNAGVELSLAPVREWLESGRVTVLTQLGFDVPC